ncbi:MAG: GntR family transcriptional regulator [Acetatifactor sp.]|nr:GntR family transcriptional regulator [Acetatifactor sp.]
MVSFEEFILEDTGPIYLQIIRYIKQGIASGTVGDQEEIPSRRALSALLGVNPNTIQKAYHILEEEGVISSRSGAKSYTCVDKEMVERIKRELLESDTGSWIRAMKQLGMAKESALRLAESLWTD